MIDKEKVLTGLECCRMNGKGCRQCPYNKDCDEMPDYGNAYLCSDALELLNEQQETISSLQGTICKLNAALAEKPEQKFFVDSDGKITPLPIQPQWHPFNPVEPDDTGLKDHNFYLVTVKGFGTPMKAMYHIDMPFGFLPPPTKDFDPYDVIAWCELPDNMDEEVKQDGIQ